MVVDLGLTLDPPPGRSIQARIYERLRQAILAGRFQPAQKLPSSRLLARQLRVARATIVLVYEQLQAEGFVETRPASGTFVSRVLPADGQTSSKVTGLVRVPPPAAPHDQLAQLRPTLLSRWGERLVATHRAPPLASSQRPEIDFRPGQPDWSAFPRGIWRRLTARRWASATAELASYGDPAGYRPLREAIAQHLAYSRGVRCDPSQVVVVNGTQQAADLLARVWLDPGDAAAVEEPGYPEAALALRAYGVYVLPTPVDAEGLVVDQLPRPDSPQAPRLIYVTPSHQFPTGTVLSLGRRLALLDWAAARSALLAEDDYDSEFRYEGRPLESLQGLDDAGRVAYLGSFSTALLPPLRVGYAVLPVPLVEPFVAAKWLADRQTATLDQQVLADFIAGGHYGRHLRRMGRLYGERRGALLAALHQELGADVAIGGSGSGLHLVIWLSEAVDAELVAARALQLGVGVYPVARFRQAGRGRPGLLLGYAALDAAQIRDGIQRLAVVLHRAD